MRKLPHLGHYWKSGRSSPDTIMEDIKSLIEGIGGLIYFESYSTVDNKSAYILVFRIGDDEYQINQPVLSSRTDNAYAAKRQAMAALYHDIKAKVVSVKFRGIKSVFHEFFILPDGRVASQVTVKELIDVVKYLPEGEK